MGKAATGSALLLPGQDWNRFLPGPGARGVATFSYRAWDQTGGSAGGRANVNAAGTSAFSVATVTATIPINTAPVLAG